MSAFGQLLHELIGLFVDDGALALALVAVIAAAVVAAAIVPHTLAAGAVLVVGCVGVLLANVVMAARRRAHDKTGDRIGPN
jgi:hypothetical protein